MEIEDVQMLQKEVMCDAWKFYSDEGHMRDQLHRVDEHPDGKQGAACEDKQEYEEGDNDKQCVRETESALDCHYFFI